MEPNEILAILFMSVGMVLICTAIWMHWKETHPNTGFYETKKE